MFQLIRIVLWTVAAVVALVYGYTGTLTYRLDEQNLCIQTDEWMGRSVSKQVIPVASISSVELDVRAGRHAKRSVKVIGKDGGILRRDFLGLQDSNNLAEGLRCALRKDADYYRLTQAEARRQYEEIRITAANLLK